MRRRCSSSVPRLQPEFLERLQSHAWPGNVRELANFMRRVLTLSDTLDIDAGCFETEFQMRRGHVRRTAPAPVAIAAAAGHADSRNWNGCIWKTRWRSPTETGRTPRRCWASACARCATRFASTASAKEVRINGRRLRCCKMLQGYLKVTTDRQQMIVSNMANVDTPGYHTKDLNFQAAMQQVMNEGGQGNATGARVVWRSGLPERPDGNNVNIDRESMLLSQTQLQYQMGVQLMKERIPRAADRNQGWELSMGMFDMMSISASALSAERQRAEVTSANLANAETTHTDAGGPYVRKEVVFSAANASPFQHGVQRAWAIRPAAGGLGAADAGGGRPDAAGDAL